MHAPILLHSICLRCHSCLFMIYWWQGSTILKVLPIIKKNKTKQNCASGHEQIFYYAVAKVVQRRTTGEQATGSQTPSTHYWPHSVKLGYSGPPQQKIECSTDVTAACDIKVRTQTVYVSVLVTHISRSGVMLWAMFCWEILGLAFIWLWIVAIRVNLFLP